MKKNSIYPIGHKTDITGYRFGRLTVKSLDPHNTKKGRHWICQCDCGGSTITSTENLNRGHTRSCGCMWTEQNGTHRQSGTPEHMAWGNMIQRCTNPSNPMFKYYGARGISVCARWLNSFEAFLADMRTRPGSEYSIERRDVNGNYEPNNCFWATIAVQANNRRNAVRHEIDGVSYSEREIEQKYGLSPTVFRYRVAAGMSPKEAAMKPVRPQKKSD